MATSHPTLLLLITIFTLIFSYMAFSQSAGLCRTHCGQTPINYPFGIDNGCGNPHFQNLFFCDNADTLQFRTPSGNYPVTNISYTDPHFVISNPFMWSCDHGSRFPDPSRPFSLDASKPLTLSPLNNYLFFNCNHDDVIVRPRPVFCERNPDNCDSSCDSSSYLCRNLPVCGNLLGRTRCCSYFPKASESLRLMLEHCESYTSLYWSFIGETPPYDQVVNYGIRIDFDMPVTTNCLSCQDRTKGGGTCGFSAQSKQFLCLCDKANVSTYCDDYRISHHGRAGAGLIAGTSISVSISGIIVAVVWYVKKLRSSKPVNFGVQNNENRVF